MKKFNSVLAFGDSHIAGCELSNSHRLEDYLAGKISLEEADESGKQLSFPQIIANKLDIPCYNFSMTGGSNQRSLRLLIRAVQDYPNSLVLFGYTCTDRSEFYYPDKGLYLGRDKDNFIQVGMQWHGMIDRFVKSSKMKHPINDLYVDEILRPYNNLNDLSFTVDNICTLNALKHYHLPLFPENFPDTPETFKFEGHENYLDWCAARGFKRMPFLHYGIDAHQELARLILKDLGA